MMWQVKAPVTCCLIPQKQLCFMIGHRSFQTFFYVFLYLCYILFIYIVFAKIDNTMYFTVHFSFYSFSLSLSLFFFFLGHVHGIQKFLGQPGIDTVPQQ